MFDLSDSVVLVTGASRGIGRAIALEAARAGADLVLGFRADAPGAEEVSARVRKAGRDTRVIRADLRDRAAVAALVREAGAWKGRLDGLVTSAGTYDGSSTEEVGDREWDDVVRIDLEGTFRTVQAALPWLRAAGRASVVTISSVMGSHAAAGAAPYQAGKAGVEQMTRALALELAPKIRVNAVAPGFVRTDMNRGGHEDPGFRRRVERSTPLGRWGEPEDIAPVVRYLLSRDAGWVTGSVIGVDGGIALR